ncbi:hypothetical protein NIES4072_20010 [Nostoc commune NIES-4072]|uniref:DUF4760 domain-containing protein n=2 Tax=Nostoc commune TaxID=1178 RepID=A0A2R5FI23_NOSCO|nr:hypothetical protein NIES4070_06790 [Nostoc commune HK-02]GBG18337.1 hypothetical protein NIES4072_20010 [Nostoc commune NIES-4072]
MNLMTLDDCRNIAIILGTFVALLTWIKGVYEYTRQLAQKRSEQYAEIRKRFRESKVISKLISMLETNDSNLVEVSWSEKVELLGFYEDIALMVNSGIIKHNVAFYMFGYYAIRCWESNYFWADVNRNSPYWSLFRNFVNEMKAAEVIFLEDSFIFRPKNYRF